MDGHISRILSPNFLSVVSEPRKVRLLFTKFAAHAVLEIAAR